MTQHKIIFIFLFFLNRATTTTTIKQHNLTTNTMHAYQTTVNDSDTSTSGHWTKHAIINRWLPVRHKQDATYKLKDNINQSDTMTLTKNNWKPLRHAKPKCVKALQPSANINYNEQCPHREAQALARLSFAYVCWGTRWSPHQDWCHHQAIGVTIIKAWNDTSRPINQESLTR